jgi:hypothetical protein
MILSCENGSTRRKSSLPPCLTQIPHGLAWKCPRLTTWDTVRPSGVCNRTLKFQRCLRQCCRVKRAHREDGDAQCDTWTIMKGAYWLWKQQHHRLSADKTSWYSTKEGTLSHGYNIYNQFTPALSNIPKLIWRPQQKCTAFSARQSIHVDKKLNCDFWITKHQQYWKL